VSRRAVFVGRRLLLTLPLLWAMSVLIFLVLHLVPGDPAEAVLGIRATPQTLAQVRADLHLDQSLPEQYSAWLSGVFHADLGRDYLSEQSVAGELRTALPVTLELTLASIVIGAALGIALGLLAAWRRGVARHAVEGFVVGGIAVPDFWLGILLVLALAVALPWLPPSGYVPLREDFVQNVRHFALPVLALALGQAAYFARTVRGSVEQALRSPSVTFLRACGVSERSILLRHALRNASAPIVTVIGIQVGALLGGAIVIETIFDLPGVGHLLVTAIEERNYPVIQGCALVIALLFILVNLCTDLLVGWLDPRIGDGAAQ
jgi:peptide/nickel transport system permease protein